MHITIKAVALGVSAVLAVQGCTTNSVENDSVTNHSSTNNNGWVHPQTPWGDPDLQGKWPINHLYSVPLVRPEKYGDRLYFTEEELTAQAERVETRNANYERLEADNRIGIGHWTEEVDVPPQTSLIVDPPDGSFPAMTEFGEEKSATMGSSWYRDIWEKPEDFDTWDRCITRGLPMSMFPHPYNNGIEIVQTPGYVVINLEMIHEARIVPLGDTPKLDAAIKQWMGDSRGHWEGNKLVVETTNFNGHTGLATPTVAGSPPGTKATSTELHLLETFERVAHDTINYSITVTDPVTQTRPWTAAFAWTLDNDYQTFEYACHEDNQAIRGYIENSKVLKAQRAAGQDAEVDDWRDHLQRQRSNTED